MKRVKLDLTISEARELEYLAQDLLVDQEEARNVVGKRRFAAQMRAISKLRMAIWEARGGRT